MNDPNSPPEIPPLPSEPQKPLSNENKGKKDNSCLMRIFSGLVTLAIIQGIRYLENTYFSYKDRTNLEKETIYIDQTKTVFHLDKCKMSAPFDSKPKHNIQKTELEPGFDIKYAFTINHVYQDGNGFFTAGCSMPNFDNYYKLYYRVFLNKEIYSMIKEGTTAMIKTNLEDHFDNSPPTILFQNGTKYKGYYRINTLVKMSKKPRVNEVYLYSIRILFGDVLYFVNCVDLTEDNLISRCESLFDQVLVSYKPKYSRQNTDFSKKIFNAEYEAGEYKFYKYYKEPKE